MSGATLLGLLAGRRLQLSARLVAREERGTLDMSDVLDVLRLVLIVTIGAELFATAWLTLALHFGHGEAWGAALWSGLFHGVSAFTNAGFSTYSDSLMGFHSDLLILFPIMAAILAGALGFPVLYELRREPLTPSSWSLHTKVTLAGTAILLGLGFAAVLAAEWSNPATLGPMGAGDKMLNAAFHSVTPRSGGFNTLDTGALTMETLAVNYVLMFIGGGSAGTAGGIKVTTFFLLGLVVWSEIRGERDVAIFRRRIGTRVERQALTIVLLAIGVVGTGTLAIRPHRFPFSQVCRRSRLAPVVLSTESPPSCRRARVVLVVLMSSAGGTNRRDALRSAAAKSHRDPQRPIVG